MYVLVCIKKKKNNRRPQINKITRTTKHIINKNLLWHAYLIIIIFI